eukprot:m.67139 g.67139  ORF g.67139 m.67139 type:complete len:75 (-) comp13623_c0_seq1:5686-5910(-)
MSSEADPTQHRLTMTSAKTETRNTWAHEPTQAQHNDTSDTRTTTMTYSTKNYNQCAMEFWTFCNLSYSSVRVFR